MNRNNWALASNHILERFVIWVFRNGSDTHLAQRFLAQMPERLEDPEQWCELWPGDCEPRTGLRIGSKNEVSQAFIEFLYDEIIGELNTDAFDRWVRNYLEEELQEIERQEEQVHPKYREDPMEVAHSAMEA
jgi:hypothetical protein